MHRYASAPLSRFEELFEETRAGTVLLAAAEYPPVCDVESGDVTLTLGPTGAIIVHVRPGSCRSDDFRLRLLFETGTCIFSNARDLGAFWTGPLAVAFGIESRPLPPEEPAETGERTAAGEPKASDDPPSADDASLEIPSFLGDFDAAPTASRPEQARIAEPRLNRRSLAEQLGEVVQGQPAALERVASAAVAQLTKRRPQRPGTLLLLGPTGSGKTSTIEALPAALDALGYDAHLYRLDCGELTDEIQLTRLLGAPPGYKGHGRPTPLLEALERPGCILLVDEVDKACNEVRDLLLGLLDTGRVTGSDGTSIDARHALIALTTSLGADELERRLGRTTVHDRWAAQRACVDHLREWRLAPDLLGRVGTFALYLELDQEAARIGIARAAVAALAGEYGLEVRHVEDVVLEVVVDIGLACNAAGGARAFQHGARELLAESFAVLADDAPRRTVDVEAGPPVTVRLARRRHRADSRAAG